MKVLKKISEVWKCNLRHYRGERTQSAVAEAAGLSLRGYQRLEKGSLPKSLKTISKIAKALNVEPEIRLFIDPHGDSIPRDRYEKEIGALQAALTNITEAYTNAVAHQKQTPQREALEQMANEGLPEPDTAELDDRRRLLDLIERFNETQVGDALRAIRPIATAEGRATKLPRKDKK